MILDDAYVLAFLAIKHPEMEIKYTVSNEGRTVAEVPANSEIYALMQK